MKLIHFLFPAGQFVVSLLFVVSAAALMVIAGMQLWGGIHPLREATTPERVNAVLEAIAVLTVAVAAGAISWGALENTFAGKRLTEGLSTLGSSDSFIQAQHRNILNTAPSWFPIGFGPGRGNLIDLRDPEHREVHNGLLAVLVELGVPGFAGFIGMVLMPLFQRPRAGRTEDQDVRSVLLTTFTLISLIFMFHNTPSRYPTSLLFPGRATALARREKTLARAGGFA